MAEATQGLVVVLMVATLVQFLVDRVKDVLPAKAMTYLRAPVWSLAFGVLLAFLLNVDVLSMLGWSSTVPVVSKLITGLIISAGSAPIHELINKLRASRVDN